MIKRTVIFLLMAVGFCQTAFAGGALFTVTGSGPAKSVSMVICLNGAGALSCQQYTVTGTNLSIISNVPHHSYPGAGIKITTPGFTPAGCTMNSNGYCIFGVSDTQSTAILLAPSTCQAGTVTFSPAATQVNNPIGITPNAPQQITINMTFCNSQGQALIPNAANQAQVQVYGAPNGLITPTATQTSTGVVTFTYNGQAFPNNISVNAWLSDSTNKGAALGSTQILMQNTPTCTLGSTSYDISLTSTLPDALQVKADVGFDLTASSSTYKYYTIDTGSLGVVVPLSDLPKNANVIGPGAVGVKYYDSSGNTYSGHYYLAPVRMLVSDGSAVQTQPIMVLAIDNAYCSGPTTKACYTSPPTPDLHYLGVGFNRNSSTSGDLFNSPVYNAFLHVTNTNNGTDVTPGYDITPSDISRVTGLRLGDIGHSGYDLVTLSQNPAVPGDFLPQAGCFTFTSSPLPNQFCGTALLDVGIDYMIIDAARSTWPAGTFDSTDSVPALVDMSILMGDTSTPALQYSFTTIPPPSVPAGPTKVQWIDVASRFVNTGRRPLYIYNYLYNGQCGFVGFKSV